MNTVAQRRLYRRTRLQGTEDPNGGDGFARQFGWDAGVDDRQAQDLDVDGPAGRSRRLQVLPAVPAQAEVEVTLGHRFPDGIAMAIEQVPDRRPDQVGAVGVESFLYQQVDMPQVDIAEI